MAIIVFEFSSKKFSILYITLCYPKFCHTYVRWKSSVLYENDSTFSFNYILIVFICLSLYLFFSIFKFINSYVILIFITQTLYENHQFYMKMSPHVFELYSNCIFMTITVSEFFPPKSSILSITLLILYFIIHMVVENLQYFSENISTSFFNCILIVFLCLSLYLCFFKYSIL